MKKIISAILLASTLTFISGIALAEEPTSTDNSIALMLQQITALQAQIQALQTQLQTLMQQQNQ